MAMDIVNSQAGTLVDMATVSTVSGPVIPHRFVDCYSTPYYTCIPV